jgi:hypothetical protein
MSLAASEPRRAGRGSTGNAHKVTGKFAGDDSDADDLSARLSAGLCSQSSEPASGRLRYMISYMIS